MCGKEINNKDEAIHRMKQIRLNGWRAQEREDESQLMNRIEFLFRNKRIN